MEKNIIDRIKALFSHNIHFSLIWKSEGINFNKANDEMKKKLKIRDNYKNNDNLNGYFDYVYKPRNV